MTYLEFNQQQPVLYGVVHFNEGSKIGSFKCEQSRYSGVYVYRYYSEKGRRGNYAINRQRAFELLLSNQLSFNSDKGKSENYL
jgi:hypothetical protein